MFICLLGNDLDWLRLMSLFHHSLFPFSSIPIYHIKPFCTFNLPYVLYVIIVKLNAKKFYMFLTLTKWSWFFFWGEYYLPCFLHNRLMGVLLCQLPEWFQPGRQTPMVWSLTERKTREEKSKVLAILRVHDDTSPCRVHFLLSCAQLRNCPVCLMWGQWGRWQQWSHIHRCAACSDHHISQSRKAVQREGLRGED